MINKKFKKNRGVSTIALVITIIVIIILASIVIVSQRDHFSEASRSVFVQEIKDVETQVASKRISNQVYGTTEEIKNTGFYKAYVKNPPDNFVSFSEDEIYGYVVDLKTIDFEENKRGHEYTKFANDSESNEVEFGKDDVYIYDAEGIVFYAKGYEFESGIYYDAVNLESSGPSIETIEKNLSSDKKSMEITIGVKKVAGGTLSLKFDDKNLSILNESSGITYFKTTVYENKTYKIVATESDVGKTTSSVIISEIESNTYTITYNANGGTDEPESQIKTENVSMKLSTKIPKREEYTFLGWDADSSSTYASYKAGAEFILNQDTTLYAIWQKGADRTYTIRYSANGGEGAPQGEKEVKGTFTVTDITPTREGYGFNGWSTDAHAISGDEEYQAGRIVNIDKNMVLYATWVKDAKTIKVTASPNGNAGIVTGNGARIAGSTVLITASPKSGWRFKEWTVKKGGVKLASAVTTSTTFTMPVKDVEIVANFEQSNLTVRYNANKGIDAPSMQTAKYGESITLSTSIPTREGYDFVGWSLKSNATTADYAAGSVYTVKENVVLYAVWQEKIYYVSIKYDLNEGTGNFPDQTIVKGTTTNINSEKPTKKDMIFLGWTLNKYEFGSQTEHGEIVFKPGEIYDKKADSILYAVWRDEVPPSIVLNSEYNGDGVTLTANLKDEGTIEEYAWSTTPQVPTAWVKVSDRTKDYTTQKEVDVKGTHYIFAKDYAGNISSQSVMIYQVDYDPNGGTGGPTRQFKIHGKTMTLNGTKPTRTDYTFLGWSKNGTDTTNSYQPGGSYIADADIALKAVWGPTYFTLSSYGNTMEVDDPNLNITITPSTYTGTISVVSSNSAIVQGEISGNTLIVKPGQTPGNATLTLKEATENSTKIYNITLLQSKRYLSMDSSKTFTYSDSAGTVTCSFKGPAADSLISLTNSDNNIATVSISNKTINTYPTMSTITITITPKNAGSTEMTLSFEENTQYKAASSKMTIVVNKKAINDSTVTVSGVVNKNYTGNPITQSPTIKDTKTNATLVKDKDYTLSYTNNVNQNVTATMTITGIGNYKGTRTATFKVNCIHTDASSATCTTDGYCNICGVKVADAYGHSYGGWTTTKSPTCTSSGTKKRYCWCGASESESISSYGGHDWSDWYDNTNSEHKRKCQRSGCKASETASHTFSGLTCTGCGFRKMKGT